MYRLRARSEAPWQRTSINRWGSARRLGARPAGFLEASRTALIPSRSNSKKTSKATEPSILLSPTLIKPRLVSEAKASLMMSLESSGRSSSAANGRPTDVLPEPGWPLMRTSVGDLRPIFNPTGPMDALACESDVCYKGHTPQAQGAERCSAQLTHCCGQLLVRVHKPSASMSSASVALRPDDEAPSPTSLSFLPFRL